MLKFYYSGAPNPTKVALFLEETGTSYDAIPVDTRKGEQHKPEFLAINPNAKLPSQAIAVVHRSDGSGTTLNFTLARKRRPRAPFILSRLIALGPSLRRGAFHREARPQKVANVAKPDSTAAQL